MSYTDLPSDGGMDPSNAALQTYSLHITNPREFTKELARHMRKADAPLSEHQVVTLFHYLEAISTPDDPAKPKTIREAVKWQATSGTRG